MPGGSGAARGAAHRRAAGPPLNPSRPTAALGAALLGAMLIVPARDAVAEAQRLELRALEVRGCSGLPIARDTREIWIDGDRAVDVGARFWNLDRPAGYERGRAIRRYRIGQGRLRVDAEMSADWSTETITIREEAPIGAGHRRIYLVGLELPCRRITHWSVRELDPPSGDLSRRSGYDALLHASFEALYDDDFATARRLLDEAQARRPLDPAPHWLRARLRFLEQEAHADVLSAERRMAGYAEAEAEADEAVRLAPLQAEGYLWRGISRGRIATSQGNLRTALAGMLGGRGPSWLERALRQAVERRETFRFFGFGTRADAAYALAQFYRLAPDAWYMAAVGTRGDIARAIELAREAVESQPVRIEYRKELAVSLLCRGTDDDVAEARDHLEALLALPAITPLDRLDRRHARALLAHVPDDVCWYSRDTFAEGGS